MGFICAFGEFSEDFFGLAEGFSIITVSGSVMIDCPECVIIAGKAIDLRRLEIRSALGVIVSEESQLSVPKGVQLITCGFSHKNAVSVTSRTDERLILSLNRSVHTLGGVIEPLETPCPAGGEEFELMACFAAKLLLT